jgi:hypothetical protein
MAPTIFTPGTMVPTIFRPATTNPTIPPTQFALPTLPPTIFTPLSTAPSTLLPLTSNPASSQSSIPSSPLVSNTLSYVIALRNGAIDGVESDLKKAMDALAFNVASELIINARIRTEIISQQDTGTLQCCKLIVRPLSLMPYL